MLNYPRKKKASVCLTRANTAQWGFQDFSDVFLGDSKTRVISRLVCPMRKSELTHYPSIHPATPLSAPTRLQRLRPEGAASAGTGTLRAGGARGTRGRPRILRARSGRPGERLRSRPGQGLRARPPQRPRPFSAARGGAAENMAAWGGGRRLRTAERSDLTLLTRLLIVPVLPRAWSAALWNHLTIHTGWSLFKDHVPFFSYLHLTCTLQRAK